MIDMIGIRQLVEAARVSLRQFELGQSSSGDAVGLAIDELNSVLGVIDEYAEAYKTFSIGKASPKDNLERGVQLQQPDDRSG